MVVPELFLFTKKTLFLLLCGARRLAVTNCSSVLYCKPTWSSFPFAWQCHASSEWRWNQLQTKLIKHFCWLRLKCPNRKGVRALRGFALRSNEGASQFHLKHFRGQSLENFINTTLAALKHIYSIKWSSN